MKDDEIISLFFARDENAISEFITSNYTAGYEQ